MFSWASVISGIVSLWNKLATYFNNKQLIDSGKAQAELEGRKEIEKVSNDIAIAKSDDKLRDVTRKKYTRNKSDTV